MMGTAVPMKGWSRRRLVVYAAVLVGFVAASLVSYTIGYQFGNQNGLSRGYSAGVFAGHATQVIPGNTQMTLAPGEELTMVPFQTVQIYGYSNTLEIPSGNWTVSGYIYFGVSCIGHNGSTVPCSQPAPTAEVVVEIGTNAQPFQPKVLFNTTFVNGFPLTDGNTRPAFTFNFSFCAGSCPASIRYDYFLPVIIIRASPQNAGPVTLNWDYPLVLTLEPSIDYCELFPC
jgi:hypothetical protein